MSDKLNFEQSLKELEQVVARLEAGECTLDESIDLFTKGVELTKQCNACLEKAKLHIKLLNESEAL